WDEAVLVTNSSNDLWDDAQVVVLPEEKLQVRLERKAVAMMGLTRSCGIRARLVR
ncbi:hypothetical protein HAX54_039221, partial [Datura stramonium]|nr:hypothetical protein [Datura stramonium]